MSAAQLQGRKSARGLSSVALTDSDLKRLSDSSDNYSSDSASDSSTLKEDTLKEASAAPSPGRSPGRSPRKQRARADLSDSVPSPLEASSSSLESGSGLLNSSSDSDTVRLSLPGSFDDTLNFDSINLNFMGRQAAFPGELEHAQAARGDGGHGMGGPGMGGPTTQKLLDRISDLEAGITRTRLRHDDELSAVRRRADEERDRAKVEGGERERELQLMQGRLGDRKENFRDLAISDALAKELEALPESQLTLKEFVCLATHRALHRYKADLGSVRLKAAETEARLQEAADEAEKNGR
jgi:hypothetical protein